MFVDKVDITEFRGIRNCKTPIIFSDFTVLIGRNNSGKSTVLESLALLPYPYINPPYSEQKRTEIIADLHGGKSSLVYGYSGESKINYTIKGKKISLGITEHGYANVSLLESLKDRVGFPTAKINQILTGNPTSEVEKGANNSVFFIPNNSTFIDELTKKIEEPEYQNLIVKSGAHIETAKFISECVDDDYTELFFKPELHLRKQVPDNIFYIKIKDMGAGIKKIALLFAWIEALKPELLLWDDFEGAAHPSLIKKVIEWLIKKRPHKMQVILSTHSIDVLNVLLDLTPENMKLIQLKKTNDDRLIHKSLGLEELEDLFNAHQDPRKMVDLLSL